MRNKIKMRDESEAWKSEVVCPKITQQVAGREQRTEPNLLSLNSLCFPNSFCSSGLHHVLISDMHLILKGGRIHSFY